MLLYLIGILCGISDEPHIQKKSTKEIFLSPITDERLYLTFGTDLNLILGQFQTRVKFAEASEDKDQGVIITVGGYNVCMEKNRAIACNENAGMVHSWKIEKKQLGIRFVFNVPKEMKDPVKDNLCLQKRQNTIAVMPCINQMKSQYFKIKEGKSDRNY